MTRSNFGKSRPKAPKADHSSKENHRPVRRVWRLLGQILLVGVLLFFVAGLCGLYVWDQVIPKKLAEAGPSQISTTIIIKPGSGINRIANQLAASNLISDPFWFRVKGKIAGPDQILKAGEYEISAGASIDDIFRQMLDGKVVQYAITLAEGLTSRAILKELNASKWLVGDIRAIPEEGSLLPETYHVVRGTSREEMLKRMERANNEVLNRMWRNRAQDLPLANMREALILASIVEKETGIAAERDKVAAVFINRLRRGMRLDSDPTILYGINGGEPLGRGLRRSEIDRKTAWNTYQIDGLPPTPICNPGKDALYATLHPAATRDLFFVADGSGGHVFARTYADHVQNVRKWRKIEQHRKRTRADENVK